MVKPKKWQMVMWGLSAAVLALPAIAMQFSKEIAWGPEDFAVVGALLALLCLTVELAARTSSKRYFLAGVVLAGIGGFALIFINVAVGIIGSEEDPRNLVFYSIPALGFLGALITRFKSTVLVRLLVIMSAIQLSAAFLAPVDMRHIMIPFTGIFVGLWLSSALLIQRSTRP
ncbi:MAG: hypothetical protein RL245_1350 [Pseudomonadota bacterium]